MGSVRTVDLSAIPIVNVLIGSMISDCGCVRDGFGRLVGIFLTGTDAGVIYLLNLGDDLVPTCQLPSDMFVQSE